MDTKVYDRRDYVRTTQDFRDLSNEMLADLRAIRADTFRLIAKPKRKRKKKQ